MKFPVIETIKKLLPGENVIDSPDIHFQVFAKGVDADTVVLMAARASRTENQDAIDAAIVGMLADPKEVCPQNLHPDLKF